jgi:hypothetical protein
MVLSGSKKTSSLSSVINQNTGGGPKKAGLPYQIGREASVSISLKNTSTNLVFLQGARAMLVQKLRSANFELANANKVVATKIYIANALTIVSVTKDNTNDDISNNLIQGLNIDTLETNYNNAPADTDAVVDENGNVTTPATTAKSDALAAWEAAKTARDALQAIIDARDIATAIIENKVTPAQTNLDAYTADV